LLAAAAAAAVAALAWFAADKVWTSKRAAQERPNVTASAAVPASLIVSDKSVAVLPFADMSEKKDQEYFSDGMAEEIIARELGSRLIRALPLPGQKSRESECVSTPARSTTGGGTSDPRSRIVFL
jgi:hypothetical protein